MVGVSSCALLFVVELLVEVVGVLLLCVLRDVCVLLFVVVLLEVFVVFLDGEPCCAFPLEW